MCIASWHDGRIIGASWLVAGRAPLDYLDRDLELPLGQAGDSLVERAQRPERPAYDHVGREEDPHHEPEHQAQEPAVGRAQVHGEAPGHQVATAVLSLDDLHVVGTQRAREDPAMAVSAAEVCDWPSISKENGMTLFSMLITKNGAQPRKPRGSGSW